MLEWKRQRQRGSLGGATSHTWAGTRTLREPSLLLHSERVTHTNTLNTRAQEDCDCTMSRPSVAPQRNLSLTEELEKLEQSITLTLQGKQTLKIPRPRD